MQKIIRKMQNSNYKFENLVLRPLKKSDAADMFEYTSNPECCRVLSWGPHISIDEAKKFIDKRLEYKKILTDILWGIELTDENKLIGVVRIYHLDFEHKQAEISYILNPIYSGNGYATKAVKAVMDLCYRNLEIEKIVAFYVEENKLSERLLERCGAVKDSEWIGSLLIKGKEYKCLRAWLICN